MMRLMMAVVRAWTSLYTSGMPAALRDARRAEIESDLWESRHEDDSSDRVVAAQMLLRLLRGLPDDLLWRIELSDLRTRRRRIGWWLGATTAVVMGAALWLRGVLAPVSLPEPPSLMHFVAIGAPPPPPPPPPPKDETVMRPDAPENRC